jgi:hypothetical protein
MVSCGLISLLIHTYSIPGNAWYNGRIVAAVFVTVALPLCLHGWGVLFLKVVRVPNASISVVTGLGLASLLVIGGILNALGLAYPLACVGLLVTGLLCSASRFLSLRGRWRETIRPWGAGHVAIGILMAVLVALAAACLLPSRVFNPWDDFTKYFVFPVRMLQTGSLFGSPLSGIGSETLGGKAFLDGFIIIIFPITYINGTDAILGFVLCLLLVAEFAGGRGGLSLATLSSLFCLAMVNPQCVNSSAVYLGSALMMLAVSLTMDRRREAPAAFWPNPAALGLVYAGVVSLKSTFILFPAVHLPLVALELAVGNRTLRPTFQWLIRTAFWSGFCLSPWLLLHAPHFLAALRVRAGGFASLPGMTASWPVFSRKPLLYGDNIARYTWVVLIVLFVALLTGLIRRKMTGRLRQNSLMLITTAATCMAIYALAFLWVAGQVGRPAVIRYFAPFLIGLAPAVFSLSAWQLDAAATEAGGRVWRRWPCYVFPAALALMAGWPFMVSASARAERARTAGTLLAFHPAAAEGVYYLFNRDVFEGPVREAMERAQRAVPAGETILAWADAQFYLNYSRNPIYQVDPAGLTPSWAVLPAVRYVLWQHAGLTYVTDEAYQDQATLPASYISAEAVQALKFRHQVQALIQDAAKIYDDGRIAVYRLP